MPLTSWLAGELRFTRPQAAAVVHHAHDLERFGQVGDALRDGHANHHQARAVTDALRKLPRDDSLAGAEREAETTMVGP
ncbi:MAG: DUF222 domain-containing protein [Micropruina sp.]